jgi:hypothetical protein
MTPHQKQRLTTILLVLLASAFPGCSSEPDVITPFGGEQSNIDILQPFTAPAARPFFPLSVGSRWEYTRTFEFRLEFINVPNQGIYEEYEAFVERSITETETIGGVDYAVEDMVMWIPGRESHIRRWTRLREDHAGLYLADVSSIRPPGSMVEPESARSSGGGTANRETLFPRWEGVADMVDDPLKSLAELAWRRHARRVMDVRGLLEIRGASDDAVSPRDASGRPGGANPGELVWLIYPPRPGTSWLRRTWPFRIACEVEAHEVIDVPAGRFPAYRVRIENSLRGEDDRVTIWFGRCGRLAFHIHQETVVLDIVTGEMVRITSDESEVLTSVDVKEPGRCGGSRK